MSFYSSTKPSDAQTCVRECRRSLLWCERRGLREPYERESRR